MRRRSTPGRGRDRRDWQQLSDEEVLDAFVAGDERELAFSHLVDRYQRRVYAICFRYFGNEADAEDAAQDAFLILARRAETFAGRAKLSTWLYRVTVNACNDLARKRARRPEPVRDPDRAGEPAAADELTGRELELAVQHALLQLDELSRAVVVLVALEGLSYPEAALALDLPVGTVKSRLHRARARLADLLTVPDRPDQVVTPPNPPGTRQPNPPATSQPHPPVNTPPQPPPPGPRGPRG